MKLDGDGMRGVSPLSKLVYMLIRWGNYEDSILFKILELEISSKIKIFIRLTLKKLLFTVDNLLKRG